jgi:hypothetical protein
MKNQISILVSFRKKVKQATNLIQLTDIVLDASEKLSANDYSYIDKLAESKAKKLEIDLRDFQ